jgi:thioesterase domain-containing protein
VAEHSTVETLAGLVAAQAVSPGASPLVQLRAAESGRPLFLVHGGQGHVATYGQLARRLTDRPVYALQSIGMQGESWPLLSIPAMARRYLERVESVDPTGPYLLGGLCMGGLVAWEMAQQLVRRERPVTLVVLLDTAVPGVAKKSWARQAGASWRDAFRILRWRLLRAAGRCRRTGSLVAYRRFVMNMNARARRRYRPVFYPGAIAVVRAQAGGSPDSDPRLGWRELARSVHSIEIGTDRAGLFTSPGVDELARQLRACLATAAAD